MGRSLSTASKEVTPTPVVQVRGEKGQFFIGEFLDHKVTPSKQYVKEDGKPKDQHIYEFKIEDTDMELRLKNANGEYADTNVDAGATVAIFPPTRLLNALLEANKGERIRIVYDGKGKAGKRGGKPHLYTVEVL